MGRGTYNLYTTWIPIGDVPEIEGALLILENSHRLEELKNTFMGRWTLIAMLMDLMPVGGLDETLLEVQEQLGGRWLTADFNAGDMLVFTLHCSLDNCSPANRIRITSDTRYQLASEPIDSGGSEMTPSRTVKNRSQKREP